MLVRARDIPDGVPADIRKHAREYVLRHGVPVYCIYYERRWFTCPNPAPETLRTYPAWKVTAQLGVSNRAVMYRYVGPQAR